MPRAAPVSQLDPSHSHPIRIRAPRALRPSGEERTALVLTSPRSFDTPPTGGIRDRSRSWPSSGAQSTPSASQTDLVDARRRRHSSPRASLGGDQPFDEHTGVRSKRRRSTGSADRPDRKTGAPAGELTVIQRRMLAAIEWYQGAFSWRPSPCRFSPTCSHYAHEAIETHGSGRGLWLAIRRLALCRPFGPSGFDPVPGNERKF